MLTKLLQLPNKLKNNEGEWRSVTDILQGKLTYSAIETKPGELELDDLNLSPRNIASLLDSVEALLTHLDRKGTKAALDSRYPVDLHDLKAYLRELMSTDAQIKGARKDFSDLLLAWIFKAFPQYQPVDIISENFCYLIDKKGKLRHACIANFQTKKIIQKLRDATWDNIRRFSTLLHDENAFVRIQNLTIQGISLIY
jgi:hypothetical protein